MAGLVCPKQLLDQGFQVIGIERSHKLGGLGNRRPGEKGKTYASMRATVHQEQLQGGYFPMPGARRRPEAAAPLPRVLHDEYGPSPNSNHNSNSSELREE